MKGSDRPTAGSDSFSAGLCRCFCCRRIPAEVLPRKLLLFNPASDKPPELTEEERRNPAVLCRKRRVLRGWASPVFETRVRERLRAAGACTWGRARGDWQTGATISRRATNLLRVQVDPGHQQRRFSVGMIRVRACERACDWWWTQMFKAGSSKMLK